MIHLNYAQLQLDLSKEFEKVIVEVVNSVGVDINKLIEYPHLQAQLQVRTLNIV